MRPTVVLPAPMKPTSTATIGSPALLACPDAMRQ
jgi:hypothetical protein